LRLASAASEDDLVLVLISGGASANWILPAEGVALEEKRALTAALLRSGSSIGEINTVRKHISRIKGGRLALAASPARLVTLAISDVAGDDPAVIGSGPTVADPTTLREARSVLLRRGITPAASIAHALAEAANETPKAEHPVFAESEYRLVARPSDVFARVGQEVEERGFEFVLLGDAVEGEARTIAGDHASAAIGLARAGRRAVVASGGELTVTIAGRGRGGPNQEYALALARHLDGLAGVAALAADTDGTDGGGGSPDDPAGAYIDGTTAARARQLGLDPARFLADNDSTTFFERLGDLVRTGPTYTNVNDFRAILVDPP
jgi:hydroxypyruvate reductase